MRRLTAAACLLAVLGAPGCTGRFMWVPYGDCGAPTNAVTMPNETVIEHPATTAQLGVPCASKDEPPAHRKTVFVRGPQQKIVVERECAPPKAAAKAPAKAPAQAEERPTESAAAVANDVILVPRTVYVPYAAQTPTRAARLVTPVAPVEQAPAPAAAPAGQPAPEKKAPAAAAAPTCPAAAPCPSECEPTTIIEIRQMNERIDRLHRIFERLCAPGERR